MLPSDPTVASCALAIRIVFLLNEATPVSSNRSGMPALRWAYKKGYPKSDILFF
ncbi:hypothetical protein L21SP2_1662 [Salinispira pacifica]|uniref:Uncharacterized protein n=1 Tax=Salinispira pacifica TaxID=1307761 RepID=V5WGV9_9SPIO|nr:hypothetical protein L21SP2_1662 [Salinispira pacifica]